MTLFSLEGRVHDTPIPVKGSSQPALGELGEDGGSVEVEARDAESVWDPSNSILSLNMAPSYDILRFKSLAARFTQGKSSSIVWKTTESKDTKPERLGHWWFFWMNWHRRTNGKLNEMSVGFSVCKRKGKLKQRKEEIRTHRSSKLGVKFRWKWQSRNADVGLNLCNNQEESLDAKINGEWIFFKKNE